MAFKEKKFVGEFLNPNMDDEFQNHSRFSDAPPALL